MSIRLGTQLSQVSPCRHPDPRVAHVIGSPGQSVTPKFGDNIVSPSAACLAAFGLGLSLFSLYQLDSRNRKRLFVIPMIRS